uniref:BMA-DCP-66, isoform h n=1 Tax=Brugia malayi TaxID=6279 RepID=A0A1I9G5K6_BRUMA|nr:BMA-DCP-66, isoform h [Brugia malayi]
MVCRGADFVALSYYPFLITCDQYNSVKIVWATDKLFLNIVSKFDRNSNFKLCTAEQARDDASKLFAGSVSHIDFCFISSAMCACESTSKGVNGAVDVHTLEVETFNGFEENGICHESTSSNTDQGGNGDLTVAKAAAVNDGNVSPSSLRRSTRACALKAAERIKLKEALTPVMDGVASHSGEGYISGAENDDEEPFVKKKRYAEGRTLDQTDCKFGIKVENDEVLLMSDESELSSLNDTEFEQVKKVFDRTLHREQTDEQKKEREMMIKTLEAELRKEEAKLSMLRKLRISQQHSVKQIQEANIRKLTANIAQNGSGHAYKPPVAAVQSRSTSNSHSKASTSNASSRAVASAASAAAALMNLNLTPQQQQLLQNAAKSGLLNTAAAQALLQQAQQQAQANNGRLTQHAAALATAALLSQHQQQQQHQQHHHSRNSAAAALAAKETAAQRAAAAKLALRRQLEQQLLQIPPPRPPPPDMHFIPNGNQPDFLMYLGLDIAVQRLLKDKVATKRVTEGPYLCEECGTDFTPVWRAIGADENSLNLYCDACVKAAQKKKLRQEHTALLRKAFNKVMEKEQELEKQIAEGKFETAVPSSSTPRSSTPATPPLNAAAVKTAPSSSGAAVSTAKASTSSAGHQQHHTKSGSYKRPATTNSNTAAQAASQNAAAAAAAAALAAAAGATGTSNFLQQQMAAAVALRQTNPMLAAMMANPLRQCTKYVTVNIGSHFRYMGVRYHLARTCGTQKGKLQWNPLMQQRLPNLAMAALAQAVQNAQQSSTSGNVASNAAAAAAAAAANPLAALAASMNPAAAAAMFSNSPQMVRQLQQAQQAMQRSFLLEYAKSQSKK